MAGAYLPTCDSWSRDYEAGAVFPLTGRWCVPQQPGTGTPPIYYALDTTPAAITAPTTAPAAPGVANPLAASLASPIASGLPGFGTLLALAAVLLLFLKGGAH